jgi:hypothetical protein
MRQIFSWRFVAALAALAGLALLLRTVLLDDSPIQAVIDTEPVDRQIDLVEGVQRVVWSEDFRVGIDGLTDGFADLTFDDGRQARIAPGTPGEIDCPGLEDDNACVVLADVLGDAIVWFSIQPRAPRGTVELPPIVDLQEGQALFENGWRLPYAPVIDRDCGDEDIPTFSDFLERFGPDSVSVVDLTTRRVVEVRCGEATDADG